MSPMTVATATSTAASTTASTTAPSRSPTRWLGAGAAVAGRGHERTATPCQDAVAIVDGGAVVAAVLADGAGSAPLSHHGARAVVDAVGAWLVRRFASPTATDDLDAVADDVLALARDALVERAVVHDARPEELTCTLLFVVVSGARWLAGQVGDGVIACRDGDTLRAVFPPVRGPFLNTTVFVTSAHARAAMQMTCGVCGDDAGFALLSDGSAESLHRRGDDRVAPAVGRLVGWLDAHAPDAVAVALSTNLTGVVRERTHDDCAIAVLRRCHVPDAATLPRDGSDGTVNARVAALVDRRHRRDVLRRLRALSLPGLDSLPVDRLAGLLGCSPRKARRERAWVRAMRRPSATPATPETAPPHFEPGAERLP